MEAKCIKELNQNLFVQEPIKEGEVVNLDRNGMITKNGNQICTYNSAYGRAHFKVSNKTLFSEIMKLEHHKETLIETAEHQKNIIDDNIEEIKKLNSKHDKKIKVLKKLVDHHKKIVDNRDKIISDLRERLKNNSKKEGISLFQEVEDINNHMNAKVNLLSIKTIIQEARNEYFGDVVNIIIFNDETSEMIISDESYEKLMSLKI